MRIISCNSPYGKGGVGQHFAQLIEESRQENLLKCYYTSQKKPDDPQCREVSFRTYGLLKYTPLRFSPSWTSHLLNELFDRAVAAELSEQASHFMGFVGKSLRSFRQAADLGFMELELVAANSHVHNLKRLHDRAHQQLGIKDSWLNGAQIRKTLREYDMADVIYIHSDYTRQSFINAGITPDKLKRTHLKIDPRFQPPAERPGDSVFRIVYVGRVEATKGVPLLLEAFANLSVDQAELTLVGGWSTRRMRKYMEQWLARDARIRMAPGDPLPALQQADVFVHPSYEDGFGYAPMEALACGVPVIVTEDTGMKEYVKEGQNGFIVPTGNLEAIIERLEHIRAHPMARTEALIPPRAFL